VHALVHVDADRRAVRPQARELRMRRNRLGAVDRRASTTLSEAGHELGVAQLCSSAGVAEDALQETC